jgi:hypothetical protein
MWSCSNILRSAVHSYDVTHIVYNVAHFSLSLVGRVCRVWSVPVSGLTASTGLLTGAVENPTATFSIQATGTMQVEATMFPWNFRRSWKEIFERRSMYYVRGHHLDGRHLKALYLIQRWRGWKCLIFDVSVRPRLENDLGKVVVAVRG